MRFPWDQSIVILNSLLPVPALDQSRVSLLNLIIHLIEPFIKSQFAQMVMLDA